MPVKVFDTTEEPPMILSLCVTWGDSRGTSSWTPKHQPIGVHILDGHQVVWVLSSSKCMKYMSCSYDIIWYTVMSETYISFLHDMFNGTRGCLYPPRLTISTRQHDSRKTVNVVVQTRTWEMHWNDGFQTLLSLDWFKGKSTGNHGFYHQIDRAFRLKFSHHPNHPILWYEWFLV
jgi:hypothetical protein